MGTGDDKLFSANGKTVRFSARDGLQLFRNKMVAEVRGSVPVGNMSYGSLFYVFVFYFEFLSGSLQVLPNYEESCEFLYVMLSTPSIFSGFSYE